METAVRELDPRRAILGLSTSSVEEADLLMEKAVQWPARYWGTRQALGAAHEYLSVKRRRQPQKLSAHHPFT